MTATITGNGGYGLISTATAQNSTSGTSINFGSIPAGVRRVTVMFSGVSTNGSSTPWLIRIGGSSGIESTGYLSSSSTLTSTSVSSGQDSTGFMIRVDNSATNTMHGSIVLNLLNASSNTWVGMGVLGASDRALTTTTGGSKSITGTLTTVSITTSNGTDTFDAGSINILYE